MGLVKGTITLIVCLVVIIPVLSIIALAAFCLHRRRRHRLTGGGTGAINATPMSNRGAVV